MQLSKTAVTTVLDVHEFALHERILTERDQAFAHSDSIAHEFQQWDYSGRTIMVYRLAREPLTKEEIRTLKRMIRKWIKYIETLQESAGE